MQVDLQKILSISGYSGIYKFVSQARNGIIVESLVSKKRMNAGSAERVSSLGDITVFTATDDISLKDILLKIKEKHNGEAAISHKVSPEELNKYFEEVLPEYDRDRVYPSHIKKMIEWYNILQQNDMLDFIEEEKDKKEEEKAAEE